MFTIENIIGDIVHLALRDKTFLKKIAIPDQITHFKILGQDQLGLWVEHPKLTFRYGTSFHSFHLLYSLSLFQCNRSISPRQSAGSGERYLRSEDSPMRT